MLIHLEKLGKSFGEKVVLHDVTASVEREDRIGIVGQNGAGKTTLLKILTGEYQDYDGEFSVTHGVTLGYLEQNAKLDPTLDIYGEMRATFAPVLDAMAQMQVLERKMAAQPDNTDLLAYRRYGSADKEELLVLCNLTEQEIHAELPDAWATAEKLIGNYADNPSETLRPYECVVLHTTKE